MYSFFKGLITEVGAASIVIQVHDIGYELFVSRPEEFKAGEERTVYAYEVFGENEHYLAGFPSQEAKKAFLSLIEVKGIGPKTALNALRETMPDDLFKAIAANNTAFLKKLPGIGPKAAAQIILDLKGRLTETDAKGNPRQYEEVREGLKRLGFRLKDIDAALADISEPGLSNDAILRLALRRLGKGSAKP